MICKGHVVVNGADDDGDLYLVVHADSGVLRGVRLSLKSGHFYLTTVAIDSTMWPLLSDATDDLKLYTVSKEYRAGFHVSAERHSVVLVEPSDPVGEVGNEELDGILMALQNDLTGGFEVAEAFHVGSLGMFKIRDKHGNRASYVARM